MKSPSLHAHFSHVAGTVGRARPVKIGIRSEDPARIWERRAPLTPDAVYELIKSGNATVDVVSCLKRVFKDDEYAKAGARIVPSLKYADLVLGIKEPPLAEVHNGPRHKDTTHMMFSHTAKGQPYNMPLLSKFVDPKSYESKPYPRLIDYELLTNETDGKRTVGFGWYAGVAGLLEALASTAQSHLEHGIATPFLYTPRPHTLPSLEALRAALCAIGNTIATEGLPDRLGPFTIGLTGTGQVAEGVLSMLKELPVEEVSNGFDLLTNFAEGQDMSKKIYLVHMKPEDYLVRKDGKDYSREDYYRSPQSYTSILYKEFAPYLTLFINGAGWAPTFPRLMTNDQLKYTLSRASMYAGKRFTNIADVSCDVGGGLEFLTKATTLSSPFYKLRPPGLPEKLPSVQMMSVDILPAAIPLDASKHFSSALMPYVQELVAYEMSGRQGEYPKPLDRATIAADGLLREKHEWIYPVLTRALREKEKDTAPNIPQDVPDVPPPAPTIASRIEHTPITRKRILMLGSGMVAQPAVDMIAQRPDVDLVIASNSLLELRELIAPHPNVEYRIVDLSQLDAQTPTGVYHSLLRNTDVVISLLPAQMHPQVAKDCIRYGKHLVTASYISDEMAQLDRKAQHKDVLLLNEIGLDPGIDHCSARDLISRLQNENKEIVSFTSFCGGLPAPEDSHVPLRYKFSWRPQGVLTAALNDARYRLKGEEKYVSGNYLLNHFFPYLPITPEFDLEGLPNRNSIPYIRSYDLVREPLSTFVRGTLRYPGFSSLMESFYKLGLLQNIAKLKTLESWESLVPTTVAFNPEFNGSLSSIIDSNSLEPLQDALEWLGLVKSPILRSSHTPMPPLPVGKHTPLDIFAYLLSQKLRYQPHERDMVVLSHEVITRNIHGNCEAHTSTLISYATQVANHSFLGERPATAMARTVGFPVAIAALLVADGKIQLRGVQGPLTPDIYQPVLDGLKEVGLFMEEKTIPVRKETLTVEGILKDSRDLRKAFKKPRIQNPDPLDMDYDPELEKKAANEDLWR